MDLPSAFFIRFISSLIADLAADEYIRYRFWRQDYGEC